MNTLRKIITLFLVSISFNLLAQDSLLQVELSFYPLIHQKIEDIFWWNEYQVKNKCSYGPSLTINFPLNNKLSISTGLKFKMQSSEHYYNDSVQLYYNSFQSHYVYRYKSSTLDVLVPVLIDYKFLHFKNFSLYFAGGIETDIWYFFAGTHEFYPINRFNKTGGNSHSLNSFSDKETYNLNIDATLKYFPIKHWGVLIKPFANYNLAFDKYSLSYGIGAGICYR